VTDLAPFRDLSPYGGELASEDDTWLERVSACDPRDYQIGVGEERVHDEWLPLVERGPDGRWWAGRFIGSFTFEGRRLVVEPRLGIEVVESWLDQALGLAAPPASARHAETESFIVRLLARLWCRSVDDATRHGLPLLRLPQRHEGLFVRGRLDVARTIVLIGEGRGTIASLTYDRSLAHPATRAIVCADRALDERLTGTAEWRTERLRQTMPHLRGSVGSRPKLPTLHELNRVRYTPITLPFKRAALLSHRIASRLGYGATDDDGREEGILVDVAELWELFVLNCVRQTAPAGMQVAHGTSAGRRDSLLRSVSDDHEMGRLKPDVLIMEGETVRAILDAKYKRLHNSRERPQGVDRADLYQIVAYAMRYKPEGLSALVYPHPPRSERPDSGDAERFGPWQSDGQRFAFQRLPTDVDGCRQGLAKMLFHTVATSPVSYEPTHSVAMALNGSAETTE
jgi:5-methylcytosine-specific restriction enzyme subunit McrC